ncbi:hypothetical protein SAY87_009207 [Trapa incisa]|uniref:Uncharacterized protein n=1 Tax=Trapa incisa TaxID=236973 RepID=A0AAN7Q269_9MYRT|nr:hypothetical protein SAY87_009207 [Trapa incisa]
MPVSVSPTGHSLSSSAKPTLGLTDRGDNDGKFFSRLVSKESSSITNSSFRVYYAGVAGKVPFMWESQPGTPKHALFASSDSFSDLPPLTPPPSSLRRTSTVKQPEKRTTTRSPSFLHYVLGKIRVTRPRWSPGFGFSTSCSVPAGLGFLPVKAKLDYRGKGSRFLRQGSLDSINPIDDDEEEANMAGPQQQAGRCFSIGRRNRS